MVDPAKSIRHRNSLRRPALNAAALLSVSALALSACGSDGGDAADNTDVPQDLVVGVTTDVDTLAPWTATQFQATKVLGNIYGTLTELDEELNVVPGLAESWETSEDGLTVTLQLREDVTFTDGSEFDAEDVVASLNAIQDEETAAVSATNLAAVENVEATDTHEVTLTLGAPDAALFSKLAVGGMAILPSDVDLDEIESTPNGTGPFTLESHNPNQDLTLEANSDYWGGEPDLDSIEFRVIPDESAIVSALQSGNVHLSTFDDPLVADTIGAGVDVEETPQLSYHVLQINSRQEPLDDVNLRLAMACAIDRQEVLDSAALGAGEVTGPITSPAFQSDIDARPCPEPDLDRAEEYLAEAGHEDGLTLNAIVMQDGYSTAVAEAENIQAQLAEVGITLEIESLESGSYVERWTSGDFELAVALNGGQPDPDVMYGRYFTSDGNLNDVAGYSSNTLDELFAQGQAEMDNAAREEIYEEISTELEEQAAWIWTFAGYEYTAMAEGVVGYTPMANGSMQSLREASIEQ